MNTRVLIYLCAGLFVAGCAIAITVFMTISSAVSRPTPTPVPTIATALKELSTLTAFQVPTGAALIDFDHDEAWDGTDSRSWLFELALGADGATGLPNSVMTTPIDMTYSSAHWTVFQNHLKSVGKTPNQIGNPLQIWRGTATKVPPSESSTTVTLVRTSTAVWIHVERLVLN